MSPSRLSPRGSSLIEAMAALVVFSVGILGVMQMNILASQQNNLARSHMTASKLARDMADAFERVRFTDPLVSSQNSSLDLDDPEFSNFENPDGRTLLEEARTLAGARPLMGAAEAIMNSEGGGTYYQVAWRSKLVTNPDAKLSPEDSRRILVMVRYPTGTNTFNQVNVWAVKYSSFIVSSGATEGLEF